MLLFRSARTLELYDAELAAQEILRQIDVRTLPENRIGIVMCEQEFIDNGVLKAVCSALPFATVGANTMLSGVNGGADSQQLSLFVLAGDQVDIVAGLSEPFGNEHRAAQENLFNQANSRLGGDPVLALVFSPMLFSGRVNDESLFAMLSRAVGRIPLFGTLACNLEDGEYANTRVLYNGEAYDDRTALVLLKGEIKPRFTMARIPDSHILRQKVMITKSAGNVIIEINERPVIDYLKSLGMIQDGKMIGAHVFPLIVDKGNGETPVFRTVYGLTPEMWLQCAGEMPEGAALSIGAQDMASVLQSAETVARAVARDDAARAAIFFSCHSRSLTLSLEERAEWEVVESAMGGRLPYLFAYSGGEICPLNRPAGECENLLHSDTLIACML